LTPAAIISAVQPSRASISEACLEPGATIISVPFVDLAALQHLRAGEDVLVGAVVQEPMMTCSTSVPSYSLTGATLSGIDGAATSGSSSPRSTSIVSAYSASSSGWRSTCSSSRS